MSLEPEQKPVLRDEKGRVMKGSGGVPGAGKKPGSPYKKFVWDVKQLCEDSGANPFQVMIDIMNDPDNTPKLRMTAASELGKYVAPQLKSLEVKTEQATTVTFAWADSHTQIPTHNPDGSPVIEYHPVIDIEPGTVAEKVQSLLDPEQD